METIKKIISLLGAPNARISYAQQGEDLIMQSLCTNLGIQMPRYIDIGTHHPTHLSNTYLFYTQGSSGVCVEPSPTLFKKIAEKRTRDICLNVGISDTAASHVPYYVLTAQTLNTFSKNDADASTHAVDAFGVQKIEKTEYLTLISAEELFATHFHNNADILSLDTEGFDEKIIHAIDFTKYRPKILCIETIERGNTKNTELITYITSQGYTIYADTHINTIFVDKAFGVHTA